MAIQGIQGPKDFYTIRDFYNAIKGGSNGSTSGYIPTTHRHFQVYLHPILYENKAIAVPVRFRENKYRYSFLYNGQQLADDQDFFNKWFDGNTHEQFSLAIQSITLPTQFDVTTQQDISTPLGHYHGISNEYYYGKIQTNTISFQLLDQMVPFFEKKINDWIFEGYRATSHPSGGTNTGVTPKVNIVIKYFKQTEVYDGNKVTPNFIYYLTNAFPTQFQTCSIDHSGNDNQGDLRRTVTFSFDQCYVFHNRAFADRFNLGYLFDKITI